VSGWIWIPVGLTSFYFDKARHALRSKRRRIGVVRTGRVVGDDVAPHVTEHPGGVRLIHYPGNPSHSFWRSQELSLFSRCRKELPEPRLDFGCGDGSFSLAVFGRSSCGVDEDFDALRTASAMGAYRFVVCGSGAALPMHAGAFRSVWANSVLEHTAEPVAVLRNLHSVLGRDGTLAFTVPVTEFGRQLERYFGRSESEAVNRHFDHKQLHDAGWWLRGLTDTGFAVETVREYQPDWFTLIHRTLSTGVVGKVARRAMRGAIASRWAAGMVQRSLGVTKGGANVFVLARRR
jgi:SAM-dependent methyltransferase